MLNKIPGVVGVYRLVPGTPLEGLTVPLPPTLTLMPETLTLASALESKSKDRGRE